MGLRGGAAVIGVAELPPVRRYDGPGLTTLDQWSDLAAAALADADVDSAEVDGLVCGGDVYEALQFVPAAIAEHCGWRLGFAERVDLGGASATGMVWRAAAAIELGLCNTVVCALPARPRPAAPDGALDLGAVVRSSDTAWGSPLARFETPYGNVGPNIGFALLTSRYEAVHGSSADVRAQIVADQRDSGAVHPDAVWSGKTVTADDVLASRIVAGPLRMLEIVMPCHGGAAVVVTRRDRADRNPRRPVLVTGCGEAVSHRTVSRAVDPLEPPLKFASEAAFTMAGTTPRQIDMVQTYDAYSIAVLMAIEACGFCQPGEGSRFLSERKLSYLGDFPVNTNGGQLGMGQAHFAGGMTHVIEAVLQLQGRAGERQLVGHERALVTGSGGAMAEQVALLLEGA